MSKPTHDFAFNIFLTVASKVAIGKIFDSIAALMALIAVGTSSKVSKISFPANIALTNAPPFGKYFTAPCISIASVKVNP